MTSNKRLEIILQHLQTSISPAIKWVPVSKKTYMYTLDNDILTEEQRDFYEINGYLIIRKLVDDQVLNECRQRFLDLCNGKIPKGNIVLMKDKSLMKTNAQGEYLYNKVQDILWDDVFIKYFKYPDIIKYVRCFIGPNITAANSMLINKPPDSEKSTSIHPLHQDLHYFPFRPAEKIVASWTAMEKVTVENGCLFVVPGSHKSHLHLHDYLESDVNKAFHGIKGFDLVPKVNLEMERGDTVFFHPLIMHGSGHNITKGFRKAISCHYVANDCYFINVKGTIQENIAKEIEEIAKSKKVNFTIYEFFLLKQRIITGAPGSFNLLDSIQPFI